MRKGFMVKGLDATQQMALDQFNERREFVSKFQTNREWARKYGASAMLMDIDDGQDWAEPVNFKSIKRLGSVTPLDRWEFDIRTYSHDLANGVMYAPDAYFLVSDGQKQVHPSRMLVMQGIKLTPREQMTNGGVGESVINAVFKSLRDYMSTYSFMAEAVARSTQGVIKMPALEGAMTGCDMQAIEDRMQSLSFWMGALGDIALTGEESYEVVQRGFAGLAEIGRAFFEQLVVETEIPMTILGGSTTGGLNTGANVGEWQSWTAFLAGVQKALYNPLIRQYLNVAFRAGNSPVEMPDVWDIEWPDLFEPNAVEFSNAVLATANAGVILATNSIYSDSEIRNSPLLSKAFPHEEQAESDGEGTGEVTSVETGEPQNEELSDPEELVAEGGSVQNTALNGAQLESLKGIGLDVASGELSVAFAIEYALFGFPTLSPEAARRMFESAAASSGPTSETPEGDGDQSA